MSDVQQRIEELVKSNEVLLFMKGSASFPMCGFSGRAVQVLKACGVDPKAIKTVNVLDDADIRQGIKEFSNWPTIPQLYIKGEFIGGSDIMMEMYESGELQKNHQRLSSFGRCAASSVAIALQAQSLSAAFDQAVTIGLVFIHLGQFLVI